MILFRTQNLGPINRRFAEQLASCGHGRIACVVDERLATVNTAPWPKVSLTVPACAALGLYCPDDVGWRCGDYGLYLARNQFPDEPFFWMIEHDVRFGGGPAGFFAMFDEVATADLLAPGLRPADRTWFWEYTIAARGIAVHRCLFPIVRVSARAIDALAAGRVALSRRWRRRLAWPNDESFVATTLVNNPDMICRDLNDLGRTLYDSETLSFEQPYDGDILRMREDVPTIYHPVLFGADYQAKINRLRERQPDRKFTRRVIRRLLRAWNMRSRW
jgi:hypothetical protein